MFFDALSFVYEIPILLLLVSGLIIILLWSFLAYKMGKDYHRYQKWKSINLLFAILAIISIFMVTCLFRDEGIREIRLMPFYTLSQARTWPDIYNQFALNIVLFIPLGCCLPFVYDERSARPIAHTLATALALSVAIEVIQYGFALGYSETDDLISNTLGASIGCLSFFVYDWACKKRIS